MFKVLAAAATAAAKAKAAGLKRRIEWRLREEISSAEAFEVSEEWKWRLRYRVSNQLGDWVGLT